VSAGGIPVAPVAERDAANTNARSRELTATGGSRLPGGGREIHRHDRVVTFTIPNAAGFTTVNGRRR